MRISIWVLAGPVGLAALAAGPVFAGDGDAAGGRAAAFLSIPVAARPGAMGNAFVAISDDPQALYFNPGGLGTVHGTQVTGAYTFMSLDRRLYEASVVHEWRGFGTVGLMLTGFGVSDIEERDTERQVKGTFNDSETAFLLGYGRAVSERLGIGTSVKLVQHSIADGRGSGVAFDVGAHSSFPVNNERLRRIGLGVSLGNIGGHLRWDTATSRDEEIPTTLRFGSSLALRIAGRDVNLVLDGSRTSPGSLQVHTGVEARLGSKLSLRGGIDRTEPTAGVGLEYHRITFDYAYTQNPIDGTATSRISLSLALAGTGQS